MQHQCAGCDQPMEGMESTAFMNLNPDSVSYTAKPNYKDDRTMEVHAHSECKAVLRDKPRVLKCASVDVGKGPLKTAQ